MPNMNFGPNSDNKLGDIAMTDTGNNISVKGGGQILDLYLLLALLDQEEQHEKKESITPDVEQAMLAQNRQNDESFMKGLMKILERVGTEIIAKYLIAMTKTGG
jgi:hypothetical protein